MDKRIPPRSAQPAARRPRTLGPVAYLEHHLPGEWWRGLFDSLYLRTDGDVVENDINTIAEADLLVQSTGIRPGIGSWTSAAARGGMPSSWPVAVSSTPRAWTARAIARRRGKKLGLEIAFRERDARKLRVPDSSLDWPPSLPRILGYESKWSPAGRP